MPEGHVDDIKARADVTEGHQYLIMQQHTLRLQNSEQDMFCEKLQRLKPPSSVSSIYNPQSHAHAHSTYEWLCIAEQASRRAVLVGGSIVCGQRLACQACTLSDDLQASAHLT